jgi:hypothetical protein
MKIFGMYLIISRNEREDSNCEEKVEIKGEGLSEK